VVILTPVGGAVGVAVGSSVGAAVGLCESMDQLGS
jgi:hypothetical protein